MGGAARLNRTRSCRTLSPRDRPRMRRLRRNERAPRGHLIGRHEAREGPCVALRSCAMASTGRARPRASRRPEGKRSLRSRAQSARAARAAPARGTTRTSRGALVEGWRLREDHELEKRTDVDSPFLSRLRHERAGRGCAAPTRGFSLPGLARPFALTRGRELASVARGRGPWVSHAKGVTGR